MKVLETARLQLRYVEEQDAAFILKILNDPSYVLNIRDSGVRTLEESQAFIKKMYRASYDKNGFGMFLVEMKEGFTPVGLCGLIRREGLPDVDIGYAFLPEFHGKGLAFEAAQGTLNFARTLGLKRIVAITSQGNLRSSLLLEKLGLQFEKLTRLKEDQEELKLYAIHLD